MAFIPHKKIQVDGYVFDSTPEYNRYLELKEMEMQGEIYDLQCDKKYLSFEILPRLDKSYIKHLKTKDKLITICDERAKHYTCDFTYRRNDGTFVISEVKSRFSMEARDYPLRKHLVKLMIKKHNETSTDKWEFEEIVTNKNKRL